MNTYPLAGRYTAIPKVIRLLLTILSPLIACAAIAQPLPDSIIVIKNTYNYITPETTSLYKAEKVSVISHKNGYGLNGKNINKVKIRSLVSAINNPSNRDNLLSKYQVDTFAIKNDPEKLLLLYDNGQEIAWNEQQKTFICKQLSDLKNYTTTLQDYLSLGCCQTMHGGNVRDYTIQLFSAGKMTDEIKSRKFVWNYMMPWTNKDSDTLYNYNIEAALTDLLAADEETEAPMERNVLLRYLVNKIIENNMRPLYKMSPYSYKREIDELNASFNILSSEEVYGVGRYVGFESKTVKFVLQNDQMLNNMYLVFMASKQGNTIYSRDSIKSDYQKYITRFDSISFLYDYLRANPSSRLDIYYFDNKGINEYSIQNVNKDPGSWARHDELIKQFKRLEKNNIKSGVDNAKTIKTLQKNDCGCNFRYARNYIEQAIFFEIHDANANTSIWFLLPDDKVLLYLMDQETALHFKRSDFDDKQDYGLIYPCTLFDKSGNKVSR